MPKVTVRNNAERIANVVDGTVEEVQRLAAIDAYSRGFGPTVVTYFVEGNDYCLYDGFHRPSDAQRWIESFDTGNPHAPLAARIWKARPTAV